MLAFLFRWFRREQPGTPGRATQALLDELAGRLTAAGADAALIRLVEACRDAGAATRHARLPAAYLLAEQHLAEAAPRPTPRAALRAWVRTHFPEALHDEAFALVFEEGPRQAFALGRRFLLAVLHQAEAVLGTAGDAGLAAARDWLRDAPDGVAGRPVPLSEAPFPEAPADRLDALGRLAEAVHRRLDAHLGSAAVGRYFERAYDELTATYGRLDTFPAVTRLLPPALLLANEALDGRHAALERTWRGLQAAKEEALSSAALFQAVLDTAGEGIVTTDHRGTVVSVNRQAERLFGYARDELIGRPVDVLLPHEDRARRREEMARYVAADEPHVLGRWIELEGLRRDGARFPCEAHITETHIGERLLFTAALRDITERKQAEAELVEAKERAEEMLRLKSALLANMSHEIRTPLTAIIGFAEVLSEEVEGDQRVLAETIKGGGKRLLDTLNSVLDLARLEAGRFELHPAPLDAAAEARQALDLLRPLAERRGLALRLDAPAPAFALADSTALARVLHNLVGNAIKFTKAGGVTVRVRETGAEEAVVAVEVEDTGVGIAAEFLPHLFDEFKQESEGHGRSHEGTGLGLAITKRLVEGMGGTVGVVSRKDAGSRFTVRLPAAPEAVGAA